MKLLMIMLFAVFCAAGLQHVRAGTYEMGGYRMERMFRSIAHTSTNHHHACLIAVNGDHVGIHTIGIADPVGTFGRNRSVYRHSQDGGLTWTQSAINFVIGLQGQRGALHLDGSGNPRYFHNQRHTSGNWSRLYYSQNQGVTWANAEYPFFEPLGRVGGALLPDGRAAAVSFFEDATERLEYFEYAPDGSGGFLAPAQSVTVAQPWAGGAASGLLGAYSLLNPGDSRFRHFASSLTDAYLGGMTNDSPVSFEQFPIGQTGNATWPVAAVSPDGTYRLLHHDAPAGTGAGVNRANLVLSEFTYAENGAVQDLTTTIVRAHDATHTPSDGCIGLGANGELIVAYLWGEITGTADHEYRGPRDVVLQVRLPDGTWHGPFTVASGSWLDDPVPEYPGAGTPRVSIYYRFNLVMWCALDMAVWTEDGESFIYLTYGESMPGLSGNAANTINGVVQKFKLYAPAPAKGTRITFW